MTEEQGKDYLEDSGVYCPYCKSDNISGTGPIQSDAGIAWQIVQCDDCEERWKDEYTLTGVEPA